MAPSVENKYFLMTVKMDLHWRFLLEWLGASILWNPVVTIFVDVEDFTQILFKLILGKCFKNLLHVTPPQLLSSADTLTWRIAARGRRPRRRGLLPERGRAGRAPTRSRGVPPCHYRPRAPRRPRRLHRSRSAAAGRAPRRQRPTGTLQEWTLVKAVVTWRYIDCRELRLHYWTIWLYHYREI